MQGSVRPTSCAWGRGRGDVRPQSPILVYRLRPCKVSKPYPSRQRWYQALGSSGGAEMVQGPSTRSQCMGPVYGPILVLRAGSGAVCRGGRAQSGLQIVPALFTPSAGLNLEHHQPYHTSFIFILVKEDRNIHIFASDFFLWTAISLTSLDVLFWYASDSFPFWNAFSHCLGRNLTQELADS